MTAWLKSISTQDQIFYYVTVSLFWSTKFYTTLLVSIWLKDKIHTILNKKAANLKAVMSGKRQFSMGILAAFVCTTEWWEKWLLRRQKDFSWQRKGCRHYLLTEGWKSGERSELGGCQRKTVCRYRKLGSTGEERG